MDDRIKKNNIGEKIPSPAPMPVDRAEWIGQLHLSNFVNTYYQFRDLQVVPKCKKVLIVGPGQGLDTNVLKWRGYDVTTFDIDDKFHPDVIGSVHDMGMFPDKRFDAVIASHVLEHLAEPYLDKALREIARVGRFAIIYLPVHGRHFQLRAKLGFKEVDFSIIVNIFNYFHKPDGTTPRYMDKQHFWEIGMRGYRVKDVIRRISPYFEIIDVYRNRDWLPSQNFVLMSKVL